jgi:hypothetical protein
VAVFVELAGGEQPGKQAALAAAEIEKTPFGREDAAPQQFTKNAVGGKLAARVVVGEMAAIAEGAAGFVEQRRQKAGGVRRRGVRSWRLVSFEGSAQRDGV